MGVLKEFKEFALKGNAVDMAVGIVIGAAFGGVVSSLVKDVMMPPLGVLTGGVDFKDKRLLIEEKGADGKAVFLNYGEFINTLINFLIVAVAIFTVVKIMNALKRSSPPPPATPPAPPREEVLLTEIRDLLRERR